MTALQSLAPTAKRDRFLGQLVDLGYGRTHAEVADYLVQRGLDDLLRAGVIRPATIPEIDGGVEARNAKPMREAGLAAGEGCAVLGGAEISPDVREAAIQPTAGVTPRPSMPTPEPGAAAAAGDDVLSAPGQRPTAPPVDCTAAASGTRGTPFPKLWTDEREAEFDALWHGGMDPGDIAAHFRTKHDLNLTGAAVSAHATKRGITHGDDRKRARRERNAEMQRNRVDRQLCRSVSQGRAPVEAIAGELLMVPKVAAPHANPAPLESPPRAAMAPAPANDRASVLPAPDAKGWPLARRAIVTAGWRAGKTLDDIAAEATKAGFRTLPGQVLVAVAQLGLRNDPDRQRAMSGGAGT